MAPLSLREATEARKRQTGVVMPKYIIDESTLHEFYDGDGMDVANFKREDDGQFSTYDPASCALDRDKLSETG